MKNILSIITFVFLSHQWVSAQSLEDEIGFMYVKAQYLLETGRYDEAVSNFNQIIIKNPTYKDALIHRGQAKYALGAFLGAKNDAIKSIEILGITKDNSALLGRAFGAMNEPIAAINSLSTAINIDPQNSLLFLWRGQIYEMQNQRLTACQDFEAAMNLGNAEAENKAMNYCGLQKSNPINTSVPNTTVPTNENSGNNQTTIPNGNTTVADNQNTTTSGNSDTQPTSTVPVNTTNPNFQNPSDTIPSDSTASSEIPFIEEPNLPKDDNTINNFVIDEDLSISIYGQELGLRKIKEIPSILILADENGKVAVDVCVNKDGVVTKAEYNTIISTIAQKSLISLALRKAREFEFVVGQYETQCGVMIFEIKGSN